VLEHRTEELRRILFEPCRVKQLHDDIPGHSRLHRSIALHVGALEGLNLDMWNVPARTIGEVRAKWKLLGSSIPGSMT
jgi:hypothetical protein